MMQNSKGDVRKKINVRRVPKIMAVSIVPIFLLGLFWYQAHAQSSLHQSDTYATGNVVSNAARLSIKVGEKSDTFSQKKAVMFEIHIASNGAMFLQGAQVVSISGDGIRVVTAWGSGDFTWRVQKNFFTKFLTSKGEKKTFASIHVGDILTVSGKLIKGGAEPVIDADLMRE